MVVARARTGSGPRGNSGQYPSHPARRRGRHWSAHANAVLGTTFPSVLGSVAQEAFHTSVGLISALIYAGAVYRLLPGPRWLRGLLYVQGMWLVQATLVLPWMHQGYFGVGISRAAPFWSWALNALYGIVLGALYRPSTRSQVTADV
jgi:hypothetical protein